MKTYAWISTNCHFATSDKEAIAAWVQTNCKFASDSDGSDESNSDDYGTRRSEYGRGLSFKELSKLHELWYRVSQLEGKFSTRAEKALMEAKADFYVLANKLSIEIVRVFRNWLDVHVLPGWWTRNKAYIQKNLDDEGQIYISEFMNKFVNGIIAERCAKAQMDEYSDIDLEEYVRGNEIYMGALEFLKSKGIETDAQYDDEAFKTIVGDDNLLSEYTKYLRQCPDFMEYFNPFGIYGKDWPNASENEQRLFMDSLTDDIGQMAYNEFIKAWPGYIQVHKNVKVVLDQLTKAMSTPENYNGLMTAISLALNAAHNSGIMSEHVGLSEREMDQLSNQDLSNEDAKIKRYMHKLIPIAK